MIPLFAAVGAASAVGKIVEEAASIWKHRAPPAHGGKPETPGSFASLLHAAEAQAGKPLPSGASNLAAR